MLCGLAQALQPIRLLILFDLFQVKEELAMVFGYQTSRHPLGQLRDEVDRLFTGVFGSGGNGGFLPQVFRNQPPVNVWDQNDSIVVEMELPGVKNDQIDISVTGAELLLRVNRPDDAQEGVVFHRRERAVGTFSRSLRLPVDVDSSRVEAELRNGVLTITLPKAESAKPRKINVT